MSCAPVDLTGPPVTTLPKHLGDIREPHRSIVISTRVRFGARFSHVRTNRRRGESHCALNLRADKTLDPSLTPVDPMFEKPQKAQVVRIKIEAVSLDSTSMAPSRRTPGTESSTWATRPLLAIADARADAENCSMFVHPRPRVLNKVAQKSRTAALSILARRRDHPGSDKQ